MIWIPAGLLILIGFVLLGIGVSWTRLIDQRVRHDEFLWRLPASLRTQFLLYHYLPGAMRKSIPWKCDEFHFADHVIGWGVAALLTGALLPLAWWAALISFVVAGPVRGWFFMLAIHILIPDRNTTYKWTTKRLITAILTPWGKHD